MKATGVYYDESRGSWVVEYDYRPDRQEHYRSKAGAVKRATEMGWTERRADLTTLRAEVEALADETRALCETSPTQEIAWSRGGALGAYHRVLDLIDKHTREGQ